MELGWPQLFSEIWLHSLAETIAIGLITVLAYAHWRWLALWWPATVERAPFLVRLAVEFCIILVPVLAATTCSAQYLATLTFARTSLTARWSAWDREFVAVENAEGWIATDILAEDSD